MKRIKQKRILFFSYVLTVLMCILIGYIVTGFSESVLKAQINETMFNAFSNTVTTLSHEIDSQQTNMYAILENKEVVSLSNKYSSYNRQEQRESVSKINDDEIVLSVCNDGIVSNMKDEIDFLAYEIESILTRRFAVLCNIKTTVGGRTGRSLPAFFVA